MKKTVRIAGGQGFWGDWLEAPVRQVQGGPIDYLVLDYVAEITMSIMQKQQGARPALGYARDFVTMIEEMLPDLVETNIKVVSDAGGVNPRACRRRRRQRRQRRDLAGRSRWAWYWGRHDDRLDDLMARRPLIPESGYR